MDNETKDLLVEIQNLVKLSEQVSVVDKVLKEILLDISATLTTYH